MAKDYAKKFYNSAVWKHCRRSYIAERQAIDGGLCETCHKRYGVIVHHKVWLTEENITNPEISLNHDNLKLDCIECHNAEKEGAECAAILFDNEGQPYVEAPP